MVISADTTKESRAPLSKERVLQGAVKLADENGLDALTMRNLAEDLGVEAMSLYYHVANKEAIFDGVVDVIVGEIIDAVGTIEGPSPAEDWKGAMRLRILAAREVMLLHRWAPAVFESRTSIGLPVMLYFEGLLGVMREGGFSYDLAHHAMHVIGSRALGFTHELFEPDDADMAEDDASEMLETMADHFPYMTQMMLEIAHDTPESTIGWCDDQTEFEFGLDLLLSGLDQILKQP